VALERCALAVYSSNWAAERAQAVYGLPPDRIATVSWGANFEDVRSDDEVSELIAARPHRPCRLVFVGSEWSRKGGPAAVAVTVALNEAGIESELTVIGCHPKIDSAAQPYVRTLGYLDKRRDNEYEAFQRELGRSHFLLLPTHADCTPLAIAEAASLGVPTLASAVGGIPEMVVDGQTGLLFTADSPAEAYRDVVISLLADRPAYDRLAHGARARYRARLNWQTAAEQVEALIRERVLA
jgi:glycosyltransferase involved in cell wall biosynthesis